MDNRDCVVLLHGSLGAGGQWRGVEQALAPRCRVFVPDLLGYGSAPPVADTHRYSVTHEAEAMLARITARIGPQAPFHLVALDYGGVVALEMVRLQPARVASATLYEPTRFDLLADPFDREFVERLVRSVGMLVARGLDAGAARMFHDFWNGPGAFDSLDADVRERLAAGAAKLVLELRAMAAEQPSMDAATARIPVHLVGGTRSFLLTRRVLERLAGSLRHTTLTWIDGDHLSPLNDPEGFVRVLRGCLPCAERAAA